MSRDDKNDLVYVGHMLDTAQKSLSFIRGKSREDFDNDEVLRLALTHLLQIIGESARRVSQEFREENPQIPWKAIVGMRTKVVHDYLDIDEDIVWDTVMRELPKLLSALENILPS
jgi:uncharacterized protein with HEPN domain